MGPLLNLVKLESLTVTKQHPSPIQPAANDDPLALTRHLPPGADDLEPATVPADRPVVLHGALLLEDENVLEAQAFRNGAMVVDRAGRAVTELAIDALQKLAG